jgi:hypothetical protein
MQASKEHHKHSAQNDDKASRKTPHLGALVAGLHLLGGLELAAQVRQPLLHSTQ